MAGERAMNIRADDGAPAVREALTAAYARAGQAWRAKDAAALMQMVTPDFTQRMPDGQVIPYDAAEAGLREWLATTDKVTGYAVQIGTLTVKGNEAVAAVEENVSMTFADPSGRPHERVMANTSQVTWIRLGDGWQIRQTEYLAARITIDGKLVSLATGPAPRATG
jgi:ketosteroid isomerase-like protein